MEPRICPKCSSNMQPGFPVEAGGRGGSFVTCWSDELPKEFTGLFKTWLVGHTFAVKGVPDHYVMGFACVQCGFVELYRVSQQQLQGFLHAQHGSVTTESPPA